MTQGPRMLMLAALLLGATALPLQAGLSPALAAAEPDLCEPRHVPGLGEACPVGHGLFRIELRDGTILYTHGLDPAPAVGEIGFGPDAEQKPPLCAPAPHIHVLYGYQSGGVDRTTAVVEEIRAAVRRMNAILDADAYETGEVRASYRVHCDAAGAMTISTFAGPTTGSAYTLDYDAVVAAARDAGHTKASTNYLIFYEGYSPGVCGVANLNNDDRLAADNANLAGPNYGVVYQGCWNDPTPMHENGHNMGAVQQLAPMSDLAGHCLEGRDVMCYTSELVVLCADRVHFDCGHDTYFHADPPEGSWLATHWNIGSRLNGYLAFSDTPLPTATPPAAATNPTSGNASDEPKQQPTDQTTQPSNETAPAARPSEEPADADETIAPQAETTPTEETPAPTPERAEVPGPLPAALLLALALAATARRRPPR